MLRALDGRFVEPGPSGAPSRGRPDVLPTGRNFFSGRLARSADRGCLASGLEIGGPADRRYVQEQATGRGWRSAWGTANMRTAATTLPRPSLCSARARCGTGPRTGSPALRSAARPARPSPGRRHAPGLRLFRDAFPAQIALFDRAVQEVATLDEPAEQNPIAARVRTDEQAWWRRASKLISRAAAPASRVRLQAGSVRRRAAGPDR